MGLLFALLATLLNIYLFILIARLVIDWIQVFAQQWRPTGVILVLVEAIYSVTDPPLRALRRLIPPLRLGAIALDLAFIVLFLAVSFGGSFARSLALQMG